MLDLNISPEHKKELAIAVDLLKSEGCESVYLFGSLVTGKIHEQSDIDLGIRGLPDEKFYRVYGKLDDSLSCDVDLVDFDDNESFYELLVTLNEVVQIG